MFFLTCLFNLQQQIVCIIDRHVHLTTNIDYILLVYQITTNNIYCRRKCQNMRKNMRHAHFAKICEKCGKVPNMRQSHICVFLTCPSSGNRCLTVVMRYQERIPMLIIVSLSQNPLSFPAAEAGCASLLLCVGLDSAFYLLWKGKIHI